MRHVILTPIDEGGWLATVPSLPGCRTEGDSREEALELIKEAIELYIETLQELGRDIPEDEAIEVAMV
jgi:predicted RNase H-like HicB family nuclease